MANRLSGRLLKNNEEDRIMKKQASILASALVLTLMSIFSSKATNTYVPSSVAIDKTKAVGEIPIQLGVSPTGAVTYSVPIEIYPGVHGMQPQLAIAYNSMAGNGLLGMGWNISGLSSISRASKNYYFDGAANSIATTKDDAFSYFCFLFKSRAICKYYFFGRPYNFNIFHAFTS